MNKLNIFLNIPLFTTLISYLDSISFFQRPLQKVDADTQLFKGASLGSAPDG